MSDVGLRCRPECTCRPVMLLRSDCISKWGEKRHMKDLSHVYACSPLKSTTPQPPKRGPRVVTASPGERYREGRRNTPQPGSQGLVHGDGVRLTARTPDVTRRALCLRGLPPQARHPASDTAPWRDGSRTPGTAGPPETRHVRDGSAQRRLGRREDGAESG